jgi:hypothetical protein
MHEHLAEDNPDGMILASTVDQQNIDAWQVDPKDLYPGMAIGMPMQVPRRSGKGAKCKSQKMARRVPPFTA